MAGRSNTGRTLVVLLAALVAGLWLWGQRGPPAPAPAAGPMAAPGAATTAPRADTAFLPPEAWATIALIRRGGPFPHRQDGSVFGNREGRLPAMARGWYREYTVDTPGLDHRGARRIVTGGDPPQAWYYTDDHYDSFRRFQP